MAVMHVIQQKIKKIIFFICLILTVCSYLYSGAYKNSAHGNTIYGVNRSSVSGYGYSRGNCAHCHEQHTSISGSEPAPSSGTPSKFCLFADNFNSNKQTGPYTQSDNFCFYCHVSSGSQQSEGGITNYQYSNTFGGYTTNFVSDILGAFNLDSNSSTYPGSYHNLYDIQRFAKDKFNFFKADSNPCTACHNPHLAKRNKANPKDASYTAISRPTDHDNLWGDDATERMSKYSNYRAPYYYGSTTLYEPGGVTSNDGSEMPDYNTFCLDCHQYQVPTTQSASMNPNTPSGYLTAINWGPTGDMHGAAPRLFDIGGGPQRCSGTIIAPYSNSPVNSNYLLSCLDCHEPHGSKLYSTRPSSYLLRKEINNNVVGGCGPAQENFCESYFCYSCHTNNHAGPGNCFVCHYHGAENIGCGGPWYGKNF